MRAQQVHSREDLFHCTGVLRIVRPPLPAAPPAAGQPPFVYSDASEGPECLLALWDDASVTALHGHVDLGTGLRTALTQLVAEELNTPPEQIHVLMGMTDVSPNQGATIASASIQVHAAPLRAAAAQASLWLRQQAAQRWQVPLDQVQCNAGVLQGPSSARLRVAELLQGQSIELPLDIRTPLKSVAQHHTVGQSLPRVDIPSKVFADLVYVHDMRMPGMLHGRVIRPPYAGADSGDFIGRTLERVDAQSIAHIPGIRGVVVQGDFVGVVAEREEHAEQAMRELSVHWKPWPGMPSTDDLENAIRANPSTPREVVNEGWVDQALADASHTLQRTYVWPYQLHASIGPSCAVAHWLNLDNTPHRLLVWAGTQNPHALRADLARLCGVHDTEVNVIRMEAAGCYGRNGADDVAADAALLSKAVGAPVRVQLTRAQEHLWEPKGAAQLMQVRGGLNPQGEPMGYDFQTAYPSNGATTLAMLLTRTVEPVAQAFEMGDRTARPPYDYPDLRVTVNDMPPILRASWLRGVSALPNAFAHESFIDELAHAAGMDPLQYRLQHLSDERAREMVQATADKAGWRAHTQPQAQAPEGDWLVGQGMAYARYTHSKWPGFGAAWAAWVADVWVHKTTGEVQVKRVVVGHDAGMVVNPKGVEQQIHGNVLQTTSRALMEQVQTDRSDGRVTSAEWGSYPILGFRQVPVIEVVQMPRPLADPLGAGESSSVPGTAAIANAIFDATGIRFRNPPFTPEVVRAALHPLQAPAQHTPAAETVKPSPSSQPGAVSGWRRRWKQATGGALAVLGLAASVLGWNAALPALTSRALPQVSPAVLARGAQLAALGNCITCHTSDQGEPFAGGKAFQTAFGTVYSTNLTPDMQTGLGAWSYEAFERAMRQGVSRDGHALYPVFPYTAFAKMSDEDLTALYAWLMNQPAVPQATPAANMAAGLGWRPLMAVWNGLFHQASPYRYDASQSAAWNRGEYLVNGVAHCGACHTPRNWLGAEKNTRAYLQGAWVDGWHAPALTALNDSPMPWRTEDFFNYLRQGFTGLHGVASGPMAQVVRNLQTVPDDDLQAMAVYLAALQTPQSATTQALSDEALGQQALLRVQAAAQSAPLPSAAQRQFEGSCGSCHHDGEGPMVLGQNLPLALNGNLHSATPDNLVQVVLHGVQQPPSKQAGFMPGFKDSLSDAQMVALLSWMRARYAPDKPAWSKALIQQVLAKHQP